jgi:hypothetical protein
MAHPPVTVILQAHRLDTNDVLFLCTSVHEATSRTLAVD